MENINVIVLSNNNLESKSIPNTLEELQRIVGGYIEIPYLSEVFAENDIDMIINDEGKFIDGLKPEIAIVDGKKGNILDIVYGNCIFASHDDEGNTTSLNEQQMEIIESELDTIVELTNKNTFKIFEVRTLFI